MPSSAFASAATVKLRMVGALADYTAAKLDSIKSDLAQMLRE
jgi:hypothetical protein